jgi:hypothetical protein
MEPGEAIPLVLCWTISLRIVNNNYSSCYCGAWAPNIGKQFKWLTGTPSSVISLEKIGMNKLKVG